MNDEETIKRIIGFLKDAKNAADTGLRFSYYKSAVRHKTSKHHFITAISVGFFERTKTRGYYKCNLGKIEPFHVRQILTTERNSKNRTEQEFREPLEEYSTEELLNEIKQRFMAIKKQISKL